MSEWTYVRGGLTFGCSPFEVDKNFKEVEPKRAYFDSDAAYEEARDGYKERWHKAIYLPFPEEQLKLGAPVIGHDYKTDKPVLKFDGTVVYSLPRAKPILTEAFKIFPQGETGFRYVLDQRDTDGSSWMGGFYHDRMHEYYQTAVDKMYKGFEQGDFEFWDFSTLKQYVGIQEDCGWSCASEIVCGIMTSLRDATADEFTASLEAFIKYLTEHDISINRGYLEWYDSYCYHRYRWAFRKGEWSGEYAIMKLDWATNEIIWKKEHVHPKAADGKRTDFSRFVDVCSELVKPLSILDSDNIEEICKALGINEPTTSQLKKAEKRLKLFKKTFKNEQD
jgi:hypothetical protein